MEFAADGELEEVTTHVNTIERIKRQMEDLDLEILELKAKKQVVEEEVRRLQFLLGGDIHYMVCHNIKRRKKLQLIRIKKVLSACLAVSLPAACLAFYFRLRPLAKEILPWSICLGLGNFAYFLKNEWNRYKVKNLKIQSVPEEIFGGLLSSELGQAIEDQKLLNAYRRLRPDGKKSAVVTGTENEYKETCMKKTKSI